jgi:hypothetical protein
VLDVVDVVDVEATSLPAVSKTSSSVDGTVLAAVVLTLPFWLGSAGRISLPSCLHPAANNASAAKDTGMMTRRRTNEEPTRGVRSIAFRK